VLFGGKIFDGAPALDGTEYADANYQVTRPLHHFVFAAQFAQLPGSTFTRCDHCAAAAHTSLASCANYQVLNYNDLAMGFLPAQAMLVSGGPIAEVRARTTTRAVVRRRDTCPSHRLACAHVRAATHRRAVPPSLRSHWVAFSSRGYRSCVEGDAPMEPP
jgi:hypothetical protein